MKEENIAAAMCLEAPILSGSESIDEAIRRLQLDVDNLCNAEDSLKKGYARLRFAQAMVAAQRNFPEAEIEAEEALKIFERLEDKNGMEMAGKILNQLGTQKIISEV